MEIRWLQLPSETEKLYLQGLGVLSVKILINIQILSRRLAYAH